MDLGTFSHAFEQHHAEVKSLLGETKGTLVAQDARLGEIEQRIARGSFGGGGPAAPETWGGVIARSEQYKHIASEQSGKIRVQLEFKSVITTGATSGGPLAPTDRKPGPNMLPKRRIRFREALTPGRTDSTSVEY